MSDVGFLFGFSFSFYVFFLGVYNYSLSACVIDYHEWELLVQHFSKMIVYLFLFKEIIQLSADYMCLFIV